MIKVPPFLLEPEHETLDQLEEFDVKEVTAPDSSDSGVDTETEVSISEAIVDTDGSKEVVTEDVMSSTSTTDELLESEEMDDVNDDASGVDESGDTFEKMDEETSNEGEQAANQNTSDDKDELERENTLKQETDI